MLKHIFTPVCPMCNAVVTAERANEHYHVNGNRKESRTFACGLSIDHIPNFIDHEGKHEVIVGECSRSKVFAEKHKERKEVAKAIREIVGPLELKDPDFVNGIKRELNHWTGGYHGS